MFFDKKLQRSLETQQYLGNSCCGTKEEKEERMKMEKKDAIAIFLSAILVFGPLLFLIAGLAFLLTL